MNDARRWNTSKPDRRSMWQSQHRSNLRRVAQRGANAMTRSETWCCSWTQPSREGRGVAGRADGVIVGTHTRPFLIGNQVQQAHLVSQ